MVQSKYDDPVFFNKYSQMYRSRNGLEGAGEWTALRAILPDFSGKRVLDLGCGYSAGTANFAVDQGAAAVYGVDLSQKMLERARQINTHPKIVYQHAAMEALAFGEGTFDVVLSSLAFHYIADFPALVKNICRWLVPGGTLVFSVEHPIFTAQGPQDWYYGPEGEILHFPVDHYFVEGQRQAVFLGETMVKYHRTLTTYLATLLDNGLLLRQVTEPQPPEHMMDLPGMKDELRRPMMLLVAAEKR